MSTNTPPEEIMTPPSEGTMAAGEVLYRETAKDFPSHAQYPWKNIGDYAQSKWEQRAKSVIAHHDASKEKAAARIPTVEELLRIYAEATKLSSIPLSDGIAAVREAILHALPDGKVQHRLNEIQTGVILKQSQELAALKEERKEARRDAALWEKRYDEQTNTAARALEPAP